MQSLGISWHDWKQYWGNMKDFRDKYAAHRALKYDKPVPNFDFALKTVFYYDRWIRDVIAPDTFGEPPLEKTATKVRTSFIPLANKLIEHTKAYYDNAEAVQ
jgi:hypothetical protein